MLNILRCLLLLLIVTPVFAQPPVIFRQEIREPEQISSAKIDTMIVMEFVYKGAKPEKKGRKDMIIAYNEKGKKTLEARCDAQGEIDSKTVYTYTPEGKIFEIQSYTQFSTLTSTLTHKYDSDQRLKEAIFTDQLSKGSGRKYVYSYKKNLAKEQKYLNANGSVGYKDVYTYNDKGYCVKIMRYRADESIDYKEEMKYDNNGNCTEIVRFTGMEFDEKTAKQEKKTIYVYNSAALMSEETVLDLKNKPESKNTYTYLDTGVLSGIIVWKGKKGAPLKPTLLRKYSVQSRRSS